MLTEQEAKAKWCPFARTINRHDSGAAVAAVNRSSKYPYDNCLCLASACMAWRFAEVEYATTKSTDGKGWCGLAGAQ